MAHAQSHDDGAIHGINVTPLVDIMLVLLLIFMITTQLDKPTSVDVELPRAATATETQVSSLAIVLTRDGKLRVNGAEATLVQLESVARRAVTDAQAVVAADKGVPYERVMAAVDAVRKGGVTKLALASELEETR